MVVVYMATVLFVSILHKSILLLWFQFISLFFPFIVVYYSFAVEHLLSVSFGVTRF